jgi:hypothetical protein
MNKIKKETFQKLITLFKFKREDYDVWNEMLSYLDEDAIDEAIITWIQTKTKTPTVAEIRSLAQEIEIQNRIKRKQKENGIEKILKALYEMSEHGKTLSERHVPVLTFEDETCKGNFNYNLEPFNEASKRCKKYMELIYQGILFRVFCDWKKNEEEPIDLEKSKEFFHDLYSWITYLRSHPIGTRSVDDVIDNNIVSSDFFNSCYETIEDYCKKI